MIKLRIIVPLLIIAAMGWYAFRPERLFVNQAVNEAMPTAQATAPDQTIATGMFHGVAHETRGKATIFKLNDGSRILRFSNFKTSNGPDVHVYLVSRAGRER